jgi:hypothetical protein
MKSIAPGLVLTLLSLPLPARAVLLDCDIDARRIYTCTEVGESAATVPAPDGAQTYGDEYLNYFEQAKQQCVYNEPRRRVNGKDTGGALRVELLKSARKDYEDCISATARELWRQNNPTGAPAREQEK